jgi:hypothetical protein
MGTAHSDLPLQQKILLYLKSNSNTHKGCLVKPRLLAPKWNTTPEKISHELNELRRKGKILQCDDLGREVQPNERFTVGQALTQICLDEAGYLPWDKPNRFIYARMIGAKMASLRLIVERTGVLEVERNQHGWPIGLRITDFDAAQAYIGDGKVALKTQHYRCHYYRYVTGYKKPTTPKLPLPKPVRYTNAHKLLERLIADGGDWYVRPIDICREFGFKRSSLYHHVQKLDGIIQYENGRIVLINPEKARLFLAPFAKHGDSNPVVSYSSPPYSSPSFSRNVTSASTNVDAFVTREDLPKARQKAATFFILQSLIVKKRIETEIAQRLVWYPRNYRLYGAGKEKLMNKYRELQVTDEFMEEERRRQLGAMYGKQKAIMSRILTQLADCFGWSAIMGEELVNLGIQHFKGALPTVENPDNSVAERVADWLENDMPEDPLAQEWIAEFGECAGVEFLSEFICRGGPNFLIYLMYTAEASTPKQEQSYAWYVHLTLAYANNHRFDPRYPDTFNVNINDAMKAVTDNTSWANGDTVVEALTRYLHYGGRLGSIKHRAYWLTQRLNEVYARKDADGNIIWHRVWDSIAPDDGTQYNEAIVGHEDFSLLCEWMDEYTPKHDEEEARRPEKFSLRWYENKLRGAKDYGMPGDLEALNNKISIMKQWTKVDVDKQRNEFVPALSKPTRYDDPRLGWAEWDELIRG